MHSILTSFLISYFLLSAVYAQELQSINKMQLMKEDGIKVVYRSKCFDPESNGNCNLNYAKDLQTNYYDSLGRSYMEIRINGEEEQQSIFSFDSENKIARTTKYKKGYVIPSKRQYIDTAEIEYFYNFKQLDSIIERSGWRSSFTSYAYDKVGKLVSKIKINRFKFDSDTFSTKYQYENERVKFEYSRSAKTEYFYENEKSVYPFKTVTFFDNHIRSTIFYNKENEPVHQTQNRISDNTLVMEGFWKYNKYGIEEIIIKRPIGFGTTPLKIRVEYIDKLKYSR